MGRGGEDRLHATALFVAVTFRERVSVLPAYPADQHGVGRSDTHGRQRRPTSRITFSTILSASRLMLSFSILSSI
jgi:hypothetical protein